jgi:hypothetical protein
MPPFSEVRRIEAAIKNKSAKELEWSLWYCRMRQTVIGPGNFVPIEVLVFGEI